MFCDSVRMIWAKAPRSDVPLFRVTRNGKVGYIDATGRLVIPPRFDLTLNEGGDFFEGVASVKVGRKWGYVNSSGAFVIRPAFAWAEPFSDGRALVGVGAGGPIRRVGFIGKDGRFISERNPSSLTQSFSEGFAAVEFEDRQWAYIDTSDKIALPQRFAWARRFSEGLARVIEHGGCEVQEDMCHWMDVPADPLDRTTQAESGKPLPACRFSFIDKSGAAVLTGFENTQDFSEGLAGARRSKLWGFIAPDGAQVIPERFEAVKPFHEGLAAVQLDGKWGFIDRAGAMIIKPQFTNVEGFSDGIGLVQDEDYMFIDKTGKQLFGRTFSLATPFAFGLAHVALEGRFDQRWGYINREGAVVYKYNGRE